MNLGDGKESNVVLGFVRSHSGNYFCRYCRLHRNDTQICTHDDPAHRRNRDNYEEDVLANKQSATGVREFSALNYISHFHVTDSSSEDVTHLVEEGICHYNFADILYYFIYDKDYFTLEALNKRLQIFPYGEGEKSNVPRSITKEHLKNDSFRMSAAEMSTFTHHVTFLIGDLVPEDDVVWHFLLATVTFFDMCYLPCYEEQDIEEWKTGIFEMNNFYSSIFERTLKPVHHQASHLPNDTTRYGPLRYTRTIR